MTDELLVEPERPADAAAIGSVVAAAFVHQVEVVDLVELIRASPEYRADLALVARLGAEVVGYVMLSHTDLVEPDGTCHRVLTLSPLAVAPDHQRKGIGGRLVLDAVQRADDAGESLVVLEGSPRYYPRFGFEPSPAYGITFDLPSWVPPEAGMVRRLRAYRPEIRGHVTYPPAFAAIGSG